MSSNDQDNAVAKCFGCHKDILKTDKYLYVMGSKTPPGDLMFSMYYTKPCHNHCKMLILEPLALDLLGEVKVLASRVEVAPQTVYRGDLRSIQRIVWEIEEWISKEPSEKKFVTETALKDIRRIFNDLADDLMIYEQNNGKMDLPRIRFG